MQHQVALTLGAELQVVTSRQTYDRLCLEALDPHWALTPQGVPCVPITKNKRQAWLFSALDHEVSRGPIDFRRDWTDEDDVQPR